MPAFSALAQLAWTVAIAALIPGCGRPADRQGEGAAAAAAADAPAAAADAGPAPRRGKWRTARTPAAAASAEAGDEARDLLLATPYLRGYRAAGERGPVIPRFDPERAQPGLNLYVSGHAAEAFLVDLEGRVLHRWRRDLGDVWPALYAADSTGAIAATDYWRRALLLPDGALVAIYEGLGAVRLDRRSRLVWAYRGGAHHDLFVTAGGELWLLDRRRVRLPRINPDADLLEDLVTVLDLESGRVRRQLSVLEAFERSPFAALLADMERQGDALHTNTLEPLPATPLAERLPAFAAGNLLLSVLKLDTVAVLDPRRETVVWARRGPWRRQHQPLLLPEGRLLLFDNLGLGDRSRVFEWDPLSEQVGWVFPAPGSPEELFSKTLGSCQRLANGNTLVTESENGRALEVTPAGEVVWEMASPHRAGERGKLVATLFEVVRVDAEQPWLTGSGRTPSGGALE
ncbi:MAG TPA: arylsulfotransferase family protein [Thermoanaerobaculia bacterium]|nr:arylsulfotransferase family protein [Thermoanaerobaculia bacterium]